MKQYTKNQYEHMGVNVKGEEDPKKIREDFLKPLDDFTDNELLKEIVVSQHFQMELIDKNRRNTSVIVWVLAIVIILSILSFFSSGLSRLAY